MFKAYVGIGYYRDSKQNTTSVASLNVNKKSMHKECMRNGFVAQLILSEKQCEKIKDMKQLDILDTIDGMMGNKNACWDVSDYLCQCGDIISEKIESAWNTL